MTMAGEHDFAPLSERQVAALARTDMWHDGPCFSDEDGGEYFGLAEVHQIRALAIEVQRSRAAMRALVEAQEAWRNTPTASRAKDAATIRVVQAEDAIRALVAHVGAEGEGR